MGDLDQATVYMRDGFVPFSDARLSIASAPVLYGLSVYTVFPVFWNDQDQQLYMFRIEDHFKRLQNSARIMAFDNFLDHWDYQKFQEVMRQLLRVNHVQQDCLVRVSVFVDELLKGPRMHDLRHSLSAFVYPATPMLAASGAHLCVSSWRRTPDNAIPSRAKINGSYVNAALMRHEALVSGFDDAIALDEQGQVTESTVANIFLVREGRLMTPSVSADLLEGITRDTIFKLAGHFGLPYEQRAIDRSELYLADEIFLCGSSMNITPVTRVDHRPIGAGHPGPATQQLAAAYESCGHRQSDLFPEWSTATLELP